MIFYLLGNRIGIEKILFYASPIPNLFFFSFRSLRLDGTGGARSSPLVILASQLSGVDQTKQRPNSFFEIPNSSSLYSALSHAEGGQLLVSFPFTLPHPEPYLHQLHTPTYLSP